MSNIGFKKLYQKSSYIWVIFQGDLARGEYAPNEATGLVLTDPV